MVRASSLPSRRSRLSRFSRQALHTGADPENSLEVFDSGGRLLLIMPMAAALRQRLHCRAVAFALFDKGKRIFLGKLPRTHSAYPGLWDISAAGYARPGEGMLDAVLREADSRLAYREQDISLAAKLPASPESANREIAIFTSKPSAFFPTLHPDRLEDGMYVDEEELGALLRDMPELTTPALRLTAPYLFS